MGGGGSGENGLSQTQTAPPTLRERGVFSAGQAAQLPDWPFIILPLPIWPWPMLEWSILL